MTDLEAHVNAAGRGDLVKQVREKINQLGIQYIYCQFVSVTGRIVGKGIPADHWEGVAERGFQLVYGSTANLYVDRHKVHRLRAEASELVGIPILRPSASCPGTSGSLGSFARCSATARRGTIPAGT